MSLPSSSPARDFAVDVVRKLRDAGYQALWAGGCVRDALMERDPKDYDVATNAKPDEIRQVFGRRRTLSIGAAFGVITVLGPPQADQIEVATFRQDAAYSDGRHPDSVSFSTAEEDAKRRDFTMNGLFYDPLTGQVIDYVGGVDDINRGVVRAIGEPSERFGEDKLRMLRAVRFAATYDLQIDPQTLKSVQRHAAELIVVSAERVAMELRRMLAHPSRALAARLLAESNLLEVLLPESRPLIDDHESFQQTLRTLEALRDEASAPVALAALLRDINPGQAAKDWAESACRRWRLANEETNVVAWLLSQEELIRQAPSAPWPRLQRVLTAPLADELLTYCQAVALTRDGGAQAVGYCREKLRLPEEELNPLPLLTGNDLIKHGASPGPAFRTALDAVRDAQLENRIGTHDEALRLAQRVLRDEA